MNLVIIFIVAVVAELAVAVVVVVVEIKLLHIAMNCSESPNFCCTRVSTLLQRNLINGSSTNVWGCPVVLVLKISNYVLSVILKVLFIFPWVPSPPSIFHRSFARPSTHLTLSALSQVCVWNARNATKFPGRFLHRIPKSHFIYLALCVHYELWVLDLSLGVVCASHGVARKKVQSRNFPGLR